MAKCPAGDVHVSAQVSRSVAVRVPHVSFRPVCAFCRSLVHFGWEDEIKRWTVPEIGEWEFLPFGTASSAFGRVADRHPLSFFERHHLELSHSMSKSKPGQAVEEKPAKEYRYTTEISQMVGTLAGLAWIALLTPGLILTRCSCSGRSRTLS
jgi:hypothetical protein